MFVTHSFSFSLHRGSFWPSALYSPPMAPSFNRLGASLEPRLLSAHAAALVLVGGASHMT